MPSKFGQHQKLTHRLRELVRKYPRGVGVFKEFLQNADDAGAATLRMFLDLRFFPTRRLPNRRMSCLQGPSLVFVNDATFTDDDWKRIQEIGNSGKAMDVAKTGRFGLGFNCVYNVTDFPILLTRNQIGIFDPHARAVEGATVDDPGQAWCLEELWNEAPDLLLPFGDFGLERGQDSIEGTIFRLPLRNRLMASQSEVCKEPFKSDDFRRIVADVTTHAGQLLLFLNSVRNFEVTYIGRDGKTAQILSVETLNESVVSEAQKSLHSQLEQPTADLLSDIQDRGTQTWFIQHDLKIDGKDGASRTERWWKVRGLFAANDLIEAAREMCEFQEKATPLAGAAVRVDTQPETGVLCCTLPMPTASGMPLHIDGFFDLHDSRQDIFQDATASGVKDKTRFRWNRLLLEHGCAEAAAELLTRVGFEVSKPIYDYWPRIAKGASDGRLLSTLPRTVFKVLAEKTCVTAGLAAEFVRPGDARLISQKELRDPLLEEGISLLNPDAPTHIVRGFSATGNPILVMQAADVRELLRDPSFSPTRYEESARPSLRRQDWIVALLEYCLADGDYEDFANVPLAMMSDGLLRSFDTSDPTWLFLGDQRQQQLLAETQDTFVAADIAAMDVQELPNVRTMELNDLIELLPDLYPAIAEDESLEFDSEANGCPCYEWLTKFYKYCADAVSCAGLDCLPSDSELRRLPLVPDTEGRLWGMCSDWTPVFIPPKQRSKWLTGLLAAAGIPTVTDDGDLGNAIAGFKSAVGNDEIPTLSPRLLVDYVAASRESFVRSITANRPVLDRFLNYVASGLTSRGSDFGRQLGEFPIFPLVDGDFSGISDDLYQATDFAPPAIATGIKLIDTDGGRLSQFYTHLGVKKLTRFRFTCDFVLKVFDRIELEQQPDALEWLRSNYYSLITDISDEKGKTAFANKVRRTALVRCDDGELHCGTELYHPDCKDVVELLGPAAHCPDVSLYAGDDWIEFFTQLGMVRSPRPCDLILAIDHLSAAPITPESIRRIQRLAKFIEVHWEEVHDENVDGQLFTEALAERAWLPAISKRPAHIPASLFAKPDQELYQPSEIARHRDLELVCSESPACQFPIGRRMAGAIRHATADFDLVLKHFDNTLATISGRASKAHASILRKVYAFIGSQVEQASCSWTSAELQEEYRESECLLDKKNRLWAPRDTFRSQVPYFLDLRRQIRFDDEAEEKCAVALGRKQHPLIEDFQQFFRDLEREFEDDETPEDKRRHLRDAYLRAASIAEPSELSSCRALSESGVLLPSHEMLVNDAPWLAGRATEAGIKFLDGELGQKVAVAFGVGRLSEVIVERIESYEESAEQAFCSRCEELNDAIQSRPFQRGLLRLMTTTIGIDAHFGRLKRFTAVAASSIETSLYWDGEEIEDSVGDTDFVFADDIFYVTSTRDSVLRMRLANALTNHVFAGVLFTDEACISMMLEVDPSEIDSLLTELRIPDLPAGRTFEFFEDDEELVNEDVEEELDSEDDVESTDDPVEVGEGTSGTARPGGSLGHFQGTGSRFQETGEEPSGSGAAGRAGSGRSSGRTESDKPQVRRGGGARQTISRGRSNRAVSYVDSGDARGESGASPNAKERTAVDLAAMNVVEEYEAKERVPKVMDHFNKGYDIESYETDDGDVERYIEVKGLSGAWSDFGVKLSPAQIAFGRKNGDLHWLYVVEFALDPDRTQIHLIQNPVAKITDYRFDSGWKQFSETVAQDSKRPVKNSRVRVDERGEGTVVQSRVFGQVMRLKIELDGGGEIKLNYPNEKLTVLD